MLGSLLHLHDTHPSEDVSMVALLVQGVLKAAAVLRSVRRLMCWYIYSSIVCYFHFQSGADAERVGRVIEKSLSSDSAASVQVRMSVWAL